MSRILMIKLIKVKSGLEDPGKLANQYEFYEEFFKVFFEGLPFPLKVHISQLKKEDAFLFSRYNQNRLILVTFLDLGRKRKYNLIVNINIMRYYYLTYTSTVNLIFVGFSVL